MIAPSLKRFVFNLLLWIPVIFTLWYWSAPWHLVPLIQVVEDLIQWFIPDSVLWLKLNGHNIMLASNFGYDAAGTLQTPPTNNDILGFQINPLTYSYSLPLTIVLLCATPNAKHIKHCLYGVLLLFPTLVFSLFISVLKTLTFNVGVLFIAQQHFTPLMVDGIAMAFQIGTLLLPMIAPLIIWIALNRKFLNAFAPQLEHAFQR